MTHTVNTNKLSAIDLLDKRTCQVIALIKVATSHTDLCKLDNEIVSNALWAIGDMVKEIQQLQPLLLTEDDK